MKKLVYAALAAIILAFVIAAPASADLERVDDGADLLSSSEANRLRDRIDDIIDRYDFDVVIVTTPDTDGQSVAAYADDYYDYGGYGIGKNYDGLLLLISMEDRDWYISTCGYGIYAFTDYGVQWIGDDIVGNLSDGEYYEAFDRFLGDVEDFLNEADSGAPYDTNNTKRAPYKFNPAASLIALAICAVIALITVGIMKKRMNTAVKRDLANEYIRDGSFNITGGEEIFLYRNVTRVAKPKNDGGGSSTHTGSSGRSHGGGGGHF